MKLKRWWGLICGTLMCVLASQAHAELRITEVMSSSGAGGTEDWFEVSNFGTTAIDFTGFRMDDSSNSFAASAELFGDGFTSIGAGEVVVFVEIDTDAATELAGFRDFWFGANVPANLKLGFYSGSGLSFGSGGDGVVVFDAGGATAAQLVLFPGATPGSSFDNFDGTLTSGLPASVAGVNGAFVSNNALGNIGSPGFSAVPEPSAVVVLALTSLAACVRRRR